MLAGFDVWPCAVATYGANMEHSTSLLNLGDFEATVNALKLFSEEGRGSRQSSAGPHVRTSHLLESEWRGIGPTSPSDSRKW